MIKRKGFEDEDGIFLTTEEHWGMAYGGVAWIRMANRNNLFLEPKVARGVAAELIAIADSVDRQQAEFERKKK